MRVNFHYKTASNKQKKTIVYIYRYKTEAMFACLWPMGAETHLLILTKFSQDVLQ